MTKPARNANPRWLGFLLAALVAALVTLLGAGTASAATATAAQTRVGAHTLAAQVVVGPHIGIGAGQRLGNDLPAYDSVLATGVAAKTVPKVVNGETTATAFGRLMHQTYDYGPGFRREFLLDSGRRADAVNIGTREVIELKPNNPRQIRQGNQQLQGYIDELNDMYKTGPRWTGRVETYDRP